MERMLRKPVPTGKGRGVSLRFLKECLNINRGVHKLSSKHLTLEM